MFRYALLCLMFVSCNVYSIPSNIDEYLECTLANKKYYLNLWIGYINKNDNRIYYLNNELKKYGTTVQKNIYNKEVNSLKIMNEKLQDIIDQQINMCWPIILGEFKFF